MTPRMHVLRGLARVSHLQAAFFSSHCHVTRRLQCTTTRKTDVLKFRLEYSCGFSWAVHSSAVFFGIRLYSSVANLIRFERVYSMFLVIHPH